MKQFRLSISMVALCMGLTVTGFSQERTINLKSGPVPFENMIPARDLDLKEFKDSKVNGKIYAMLQFKNIPSEAEKERITATGIKLLAYQPDYAFMAEVPARISGGELSNLGIEYFVPIKPRYKFSREIAAENYPTYSLSSSDVINVSVYTYNTLELSTLVEALKANGIKLYDHQSSKKGIAVSVKIVDLEKLGGIPEVMYIEPIEAPAVPDGIKGRTNHRANLLSTVPGTGFDGTGVITAVADDGGISHEDFRGRLTDFNGSSGGTHGDMTAGLVAGCGNIDPTKVGMATGAYLNMYGISGYPHVVNAIANLASLGTVITSTSYSQGCGGVYDASARDVDADVHDEPVLLHVFSAGNSSSNTCSSVYGSIVAPDGRYYGNITGGRKAAKNTIAVANMLYDDSRVASSSRGPCEDGRMKPDISSTGASQQSTGPDNTYLGAGGTSAAAPGVAGVSAMLYQAYKSGNGGNNPNSTLIKGIMLNTADDLGRPQQDYDHGWGRINARRAVEVVSNTQYYSGSINNGGNNSHTVNVPSNVKELKVMVIWLDPEGSTVAAKALVNDLNMTVTTPSSQVFNPWILSKAAHIDSLQKDAYRGVDNVNNMEQVTIENPSSGAYVVNVNGATVPSGPQNYFVVYSFVKNEIVMTYPNGGESFVPGETEVLHWDAYGNTGNFTIQYSTNGGGSWTTISSTVNGANRYYDWTVPSIAANGQVRVRVTRSGLTGSSTNFNVMALPGNVSVASTGTSTAQVTWTAVAGANIYDVYSLGTKYMQVIGTTGGTSYNLTGLSNGDENWYAVRARNTTNSITGRRSNGEEYSHTTNANSCTDCNNGTYSGFPYSEGFEAGIGLWCQGANDDIDWTRKTGSTTSSNTGPSSASEGSYYMYIEASSPNYPSKRATLESPCFDFPNGNISMTFDYHMYGATMGTLTLEASTNNGTSWTPVWTLSGDQGNAWSSALVNLSAYAGSNTILRFNGVTGTSYTGDMSIDRINITTTSSACLASVVSLPYTQNFDGMSLCGNTSFSCNADGNCSLGSGWANASGDDIDWSVDNSNTPSSSTGPSNDHTSGSGRYLYTEASSCFNNTGIVHTPCFNFSSAPSPSASFWYHMYGSNTGTLSVQASTDYGVTWSANLWSLSGDQGNAWNQATINLSAYTGQTQVMLRFVGLTGASWQSDIAIDDFTMVSGDGEMVENTENEASITSTEEVMPGVEVDAILYPNPAKDVVVLQTTGLTEHVSYRIIDLVGHEIKNISSSMVGNGAYEINVSNLSTGTYILRLESNELTKTIRFNVVK